MARHTIFGSVNVCKTVLSHAMWCWPGLPLESRPTLHGTALNTSVNKNQAVSCQANVLNWAGLGIAYVWKMAGNAWTDSETCLLDLWGDEAIQALLEGCTRNKHII